MSNKDQPVQPTTNLEDTMLVAFLKLKGLIAIPWISRDDKDDPRVSFDIQGDAEEIERYMFEFYNNSTVGVQDFCRQLRDVKSTLYNMKKVGRG